MRRGWAAGLLAVALLAATPVAAEPVKVRLKEGNSRGFLALRPPGGDPIAYGELVQKPVGTLIANRLFFNFKDGSVYDETVTFSQDGLFRLEAYRLTQRGPSLPLTDVAFDRRSGATPREPRTARMEKSRRRAASSSCRPISTMAWP